MRDTDASRASERFSPGGSRDCKARDSRILCMKGDFYMMFLILAAFWFLVGGFCAVALMSCFAVAKREDEQQEVMLAYLKK